MSGIFGIFNRDGRPVEMGIVNAMLDTASSWQPDDSGIWAGDAVAFGHAMLWNTPESRHEHLPREHGHLAITMDARLDNREELAKKLRIFDRLTEEVTDSDLIIMAYREWGEECPAYLLGDFAFAIWDERRQQLFCARDHVGIKPLFYYNDEVRFIFANFIEALLAHPGIDRRINEKQVACYLRAEDHLHNLTFFEHIHRLPPATSMVVSRGEMSTNRYWFPEHPLPVRLATPQAYANRLEELLVQAVRARLRTAYPVTTHLSGGLDSSSVATIAARLLGHENRRLLAFNWVAEPGPGDDADYYEWSYSRRLAEREQIEHHHVQLDAAELAKIFSELDIANNDTVDLWYEFIVRKEARKRSSRVILSGWGGDQLISSYGRGFFPELFYQGRIVKSIRKLKKFVSDRKYTAREFLKLYFRVVIWNTLPPGLRALFHRNSQEPDTPLLCLTQQFRDSVGSHRKTQPYGNEKSVRKVQLSYLNEGHLQQRTESWSIASLHEKIEYRYPLLDKRVVEFALNVPSELFLKDSTSRYLYREAMRKILPEEIRLHTEKDEPRRVDLFLRICGEALRLATKNSTISQNRYIDYDCLATAVHSTDHEQKDLIDRITQIDSLSRAYLVLNSRSLSYNADSRNDHKKRA